MPRGIYRRKSKAKTGARPKASTRLQRALVAVERVIRRAYHAGADSRQVDEAYTSARVAYARDWVEARLSKRSLR